MKKFILPVIIVVLLVTLAGCSNKTDGAKLLDQEGIAPYELSEGENYILQSFGMGDNSQMISFHAPKEAITLDVNVYRLGNDQNWDDIGGGAVSIGLEREPTEQLSGTFTMQLKNNYALDFHINASGLASYQTDEISLDKEIIGSAKGFLKEFQEIEMNKEIPVAIMVYDSGTSMRSYSLQDFFEPSKFDQMDLVQAVTLSFSNQEL